MWNPPIALTSEEQKIVARTRKTRKFFAFLREHRHELLDGNFQHILARSYRPEPSGQEPVAAGLLARATLLQAYGHVGDRGVHGQPPDGPMGGAGRLHHRTSLAAQWSAFYQAGLHVGLCEDAGDLPGGHALVPWPHGVARCARGVAPRLAPCRRTDHDGVWVRRIDFHVLKIGNEFFGNEKPIRTLLYVGHGTLPLRSPPHGRCGSLLSVRFRRCYAATGPNTGK